MKQLISSVLFAVFLTGCVAGNSHSSIDTRHSLVAALNSQQDGFQGIIVETGENFTIQSTSANSTRICRVVTIDTSDRFIVESFCKIKGGAWR